MMTIPESSSIVPLDSPLHVDVGCFEGPLELLLYLIRVQEVDIWDVSLSEICDRYIEVIERSRNLDIEVGGEFLVIAATLLEIKSRRLLPVDAADGDTEAVDPREELIRQVLAYSECRKWAELLCERQDDAVRWFERGFFEHARRVEEDESTYSAYTIFSAYQKLLASTYGTAARVINLDERATSFYMETILKRLGEKRAVSFFSLFQPGVDRLEVIGTFLAILELSKDGKIELQQGTSFGSIRLTLTNLEKA